MSFYEERLEPMLRKTAKVIEETPHMQDIVNGTMSMERFRFQIRQNYQYLMDYDRSWATAMGKTDSFEDMEMMFKIVSSTMDTVKYNREYWAKVLDMSVEEMDAVIEAPGKRSYTAYQSMIAHTCDLAGMFMSVFPCNIMYRYFGEDLLPLCKLDKDNMHYKWLEFYVTDSYLKKTENEIAAINRLCKNKSEKEIARLLEICATSCNYEILQWQDLYHNMTTWPLDEIFPAKHTTIKED